MNKASDNTKTVGKTTKKISYTTVVEKEAVIVAVPAQDDKNMILIEPRGEGMNAYYKHGMLIKESVRGEKKVVKIMNQNFFGILAGNFGRTIVATVKVVTKEVDGRSYTALDITRTPGVKPLYGLGLTQKPEGTTIIGTRTKIVFNPVGANKKAQGMTFTKVVDKKTAGPAHTAKRGAPKIIDTTVDALPKTAAEAIANGWVDTHKGIGDRQMILEKGGKTITRYIPAKHRKKK